MTKNKTKLKKVNKNKELALGVIGAGYWGKNLIRNFDKTENINLDYICDLDQKKLTELKKTYRHTRFTPNYLDILQDKSIDAVAIALPVNKHFKYAKDALNYGKHVLLEKPMTSTSDEAKELVKIAKDKGLILMIDHIFEYDESIKKIKEICKSKELGKIYYIRAEWLNLGLLQPDVNVIWDLAPHLISVINSITSKDKLKSVNATAQGFIRKDIAEFGKVQLNYSKGLKAYLSFGWLEPKKTRTLTFVGSKKMLVYDMTNNEEPIKIYDKSVSIKDKDIQSRINYKYGDIVAPAIKNIESLSNLCSHFKDCILKGIIPQTSGEEGIKIIETLEAMDKSIKNNGSEVKL